MTVKLPRHAAASLLRTPNMNCVWLTYGHIAKPEQDHAALRRLPVQIDEAAVVLFIVGYDHSFFLHGASQDFRIGCRRHDLQGPSYVMAGATKQLNHWSR